MSTGSKDDLSRAGGATVIAASIVGRGLELWRISELLKAGARTVAVVGPTSVGKSRLAARFVAEELDRSQVTPVAVSVEHDVRGHVAEIEEALRGGQAPGAPLVFLDDADGIGALLADATLTIPPGSRVLITTREQSVPGAELVALGPVAFADVIRFAELSALINAAVALHDHGDLEGARDRLETAVQLADALHQTDLLAFAAALLAATDAALGRYAEADDLVHWVVSGRADLAATVLTGFVDLARCVAARTAGRRDEAERFLGQAEGRLKLRSGSLSIHARHRLAYAVSSLGAAVERESSALSREPVYQFGADAAWVQVRDSCEIDLGRRPQLRRILQVLLDSFQSHPGAVMSAAVLFEQSWPGQSISAESAANRVRVAIATLRGLGLRNLVQLHGGGYRLDPSAVIRVGR
jgi:hypothetical protein